MDSPVSSRFQAVLSFLASTSQQLALRYLASLEARNYATGTLKAVVDTLKSLTTHLPDSRRAALVDDFALTTSQDISDYISAAQKAGLGPSTINTKLSILGEFFEFLREDEVMTQQPVLRRRHRLLAPITLPKPMNQTDLVAFFKVIDSVRAFTNKSNSDHHSPAHLTYYRQPCQRTEHYTQKALSSTPLRSLQGDFVT